MLLSTLRHLEATLDAETAALLAHDMSAQDDFHRRKSQCLVDMARLGRRAIRTDDPATLDCLHRVRAKLGRNHEVVGIHLRAMQEVADIVATMAENAESDGTYSASLRHVD